MLPCQMSHRGVDPSSTCRLAAHCRRAGRRHAAPVAGKRCMRGRPIGKLVGELVRKLVNYVGHRGWPVPTIGSRSQCRQVCAALGSLWGRWAGCGREPLGVARIACSVCVGGGLLGHSAGAKLMKCGRMSAGRPRRRGQAAPPWIRAAAHATAASRRRLRGEGAAFLLDSVQGGARALPAAVPPGGQQALTAAPR
jgi:hypothetical protein